MYQLVVQLISPYPFLVVGLAASLVCVWRSKALYRRGLIIASVLLGLLWMLSTTVAGYLCLGSLEWHYPPSNEVPAPTDTIVVLSGSLFVDDPAGTKVRVGPDTFYRCLHAAHLYHQAGHCRIVVSGGKVDWSDPGPTLAKGMHDFLMELGVQESDLVLEDKSSNTYENAYYSSVLLNEPQQGRVFLVTDAVHMGRAQKCFAAQQITVTPAPCNHRARRLELSLLNFLPSVSGISGVQTASHEWLGLIRYRLRGRI